MFFRRNYLAGFRFVRLVLGLFIYFSALAIIYREDAAATTECLGDKGDRTIRRYREEKSEFHAENIPSWNRGCYFDSFFKLIDACFFTLKRLRIRYTAIS